VPAEKRNALRPRRATARIVSAEADVQSADVTSIRIADLEITAWIGESPAPHSRQQ